MSGVSLSRIARDTGLFTDGDWVESKDQDNDGDVRLIQLADVADGYFKDKSQRFLTSETANRLRCTFLEEDDILIARMPDPIGRACLFPRMTGRYATVVDVSILRTDRSVADPQYVCHMINTVEFRKLIQQHVKGSTRTRISRGNLGGLEIPLPPLDEQKRIARILDQADALRRLRARALEKLNTLGQAVFQEMFGDMPADTMLSEVTLKITDGTHAAPEWSENEEVPFLFVSSIRDKKIDTKSGKFVTEEEYKLLIKRTNLCAGDILYTCVGSYGNTAVVQKDCKFVFQRHIAHLKPNYDLLTSDFLSHALETQDAKLQADRTATGIAQKTMTLKALRNLRIPLPSVERQRKFTEIVQEIKSNDERVRAAAKSSASLFASLQSAAFQGRL